MSLDDAWQGSTLSGMAAGLQGRSEALEKQAGYLDRVLLCTSVLGAAGARHSCRLRTGESKPLVLHFFPVGKGRALKGPLGACTAWEVEPGEHGLRNSEAGALAGKLVP